MKTTGESFPMTSGSVQGVQEREQDIWKKVCEQLTDITSGMSEEEKQDYEKKIRAKLQRGANLSVEELNYLRIHNPELYRSAMRVKTAKQQLKEQLRHCKSKQEANTLIVRAISRISDKDPDKTYLTAGLRKVAEEFKKSFRYARLPETNDQKKDKKAQTFYQELKAKGYTRRQFLKFCGIMGAMLGLHQTGIAQVVNALQTKPRKPVLWFHFQECTCCSESFLRSSHPLVGQILLEMISLDYSDTLMAASGFQAEEVRTRSMKENWGKYIMIVEGSIPLGNPGYCTIAGHSAKQVFDEAAHGASAIIAWGNCASSGCIQGAYPNPTDTKPVHKIISGKPVINVQGCPPIADVMAGVITYILTFDRLPELDNMGRPVSFYGRRIHDTCYRRPAYDAGLFVEAFDDENAKKGYCLYKMGCKGPNTFNSCAVIKWNEGVSYPIQSGHGCIG